MQGDPSKDAYTMYNAIKEGNLQLVRELINGGININYAERISGHVPLLTACRYNKLDIFNELLKHNPDLNLHGSGKSGLTALMLAARRNNLIMVRELLNRGADINAHDNDRMTTLHVTVYKPSENIIEIVRELLNRGVDINARNNFGVTALHLAVIRPTENTIEIVRELLNRGADINARGNTNGRTALHLALIEPSENTIEIVRELLNRGADKNIVDIYGDTPEMMIENTNLDDIKALFHPAPPPDEPSLTAKLETKDDTGEEKTCGVCRDDYTNGQTLYLLNPCNHVFHQDCLKSWTDTGRNTCPTCQVHIVNKRELILSEKDEDKYTGPDIFLGGYYNKFQKYINKLKKL
jgi:ankyrin repeat protein